MAKNNRGDILTCDWNPVIGCEKYSAGCKNCWYLSGIFTWQKRLGIIPEHVKPDEAYLFENRLTVDNLRLKGGIVGICQNGDLFWDQVPDEYIIRMLDIIEKTVLRKRKIPTYLFWTKRAKRMTEIINRKYPDGAPDYMAFAVSVEDQYTADERLPHLLAINGKKVIAIEPLIAEISIVKYINDVDWIVVGSETGKNARPIEIDWVRKLRDEAKSIGLPFFIKQLGAHHKDSIRKLDGVEWNEFPEGFIK